jgi:hypothetical protein
MHMMNETSEPAMGKASEDALNMNMVKGAKALQAHWRCNKHWRCNTLTTQRAMQARPHSPRGT